MSLQYQPQLNKEDINDLPLYKYEGDIVLVSSEDELQAALPAISAEKILGFDTETRPTFRKGDSHSPALIQLATAEVVYLIQLRKIPLDARIAGILANAAVIKSGVAIADDMRFLQKLHPFQPAGGVDLASLARKHNIKMQGLRGLAAVFMGVRISKSARCSNWNKTILTSQQVSYAATDAWVSRQIYLGMLQYNLL